MLTILYVGGAWGQESPNVFYFLIFFFSNPKYCFGAFPTFPSPVLIFGTRHSPPRRTLNGKPKNLFFQCNRLSRKRLIMNEPIWEQLWGYFFSVCRDNGKTKWLKSHRDGNAMTRVSKDWWAIIPVLGQNRIVLVQCHIGAVQFSNQNSDTQRWWTQDNTFLLLLVLPAQ